MPTLVGMRVELPPGYVPPEPTHPSYGYLTPQERAELEAEERARLGIVPEGAAAEKVAEEGAEAVEEPVTSGWSPPPSPLVAGGKTVVESTPSIPPPTGEVEEVEAVEATVAHTGWVPEPPPVEPVPATLGEFRWDARAQQWVTTTAVAEGAEEEPAPDVAAAAGGRGASSSWTSADGSRYRWDARAQRWVTDPPGGST